ncbi:MAG: hypothetical protein CME06_17985 [Gemmatimonadetes bacterium]|nr:hypothetical protein [Gemmatimonadota bacterium]
MTTPPPPGTREWRAAVAALHAGLDQAHYGSIEQVPTATNRFAFPLEWSNLRAAITGKGRRLMEHTVSPTFHRARFRKRHPTQERLFGLFFLGEATARARVSKALDSIPDAPALEELVELGILADQERRLRSTLRFVPLGGDLFVTDPPDRSIPGFTYLGRDSAVLSDLLRSALRGRSFERALDLCCGCGVQALAVSHHAGSVEGSDINPRAVAFAELNAKLNGKAPSVSFRVADLASGAAPPFDLIVANPPYVWMPDSERAANLDGFGGAFGLEIVGKILAELDCLLAPHGEAHLVAESPVLDGTPLLPRIAAEFLGETNIGASLAPLWYSVHRHRAAFQRRGGSSYNIYYHLVASRDLPPGIRIQDLRWPSRLAYGTYVRMAARAFAKPRGKRVPNPGASP